MSEHQDQYTDRSQSSGYEHVFDMLTSQKEAPVNQKDTPTSIENTKAALSHMPPTPPQPQKYKQEHIEAVPPVPVPPASEASISDQEYLDHQTPLLESDIDRSVDEPGSISEVLQALSADSDIAQDEVDNVIDDDNVDDINDNNDNINLEIEHPDLTSQTITMAPIEVPQTASSPSAQILSAAQPSRAHLKINGTQLSDPQALIIKDTVLHHPHKAATVWCYLLGSLMILCAAAVWWIAVQTLEGQEFDDLVWEKAHTAFEIHAHCVMPIIIFCTTPDYIIGVITIIFIVGIIITLCRKRWWLLVQEAIFSAICIILGLTLKRFLPRPLLDHSSASIKNTSPSGHSIAIFAACVVLLISVNAAWRWIIYLLDAVIMTTVGTSLVVEQWHRPSDVIVAFSLITGVTLIILGLTHNTGMDKPGKRHSSPILQVISTITLIISLCGIGYGIYLISQVLPGLGYTAVWVERPAILAAFILIGSVALFGSSLIVIMRQITASPLSALGLVGPPPEPSQK